MNFTYKDWENIKQGTPEYYQLCYKLWTQYGENLKAMYLPDDVTKQQKIQKLTEIINSRNELATRDMENLIINIKNEKVTDEYINQFFKYDKKVIYTYLAMKTAEYARNQDMYHYFKTELDKLTKKGDK